MGIPSTIDLYLYMLTLVRRIAKLRILVRIAGSENASFVLTVNKELISVRIYIASRPQVHYFMYMDMGFAEAYVSWASTDCI